MTLRLAVALLASIGLQAEYRVLTEPVPKREKPPVLFITGHDSICASEKSAELPFSILNFGVFDQVMERAGRISLHFNVCDAPNRPPIEEIANVLRAQLAALRYEDGTPVRDIDVIAHSMGGLVLRSYLSGKQLADGVFDPPAEVPFRKLVFLGTPHFGTPVAYEYETDPQLREIALGSKFLFDLARWNGGRDDLRGLDAIALIGTAGMNTIYSGFTDSVVPLTSGSLDFVRIGRTRVLPACHTAGGLGALLLCQSGALGIARVDGDSHPTVRAVLSFFDDTNEWKMIGSSPEADPNLSQVAAVLVRSEGDVGVLPGFRLSAAGINFTDRASGVLTLGADGYRVMPGVSAALVSSSGPVLRSVRIEDGIGVLEGARLQGATVELLQGDKAPVGVQVVENTGERVKFALPDAQGMVALRVTGFTGVSRLTWLLPRIPTKLLLLQ